MLNPFPIQFLSMLAYFILRVTVGLVFFILGIRHWKQRKPLYQTLVLNFFPFGKTLTLSLILVELSVSALFLLGAYTQVAALITILMSTIMLFLRNKFSDSSLPSKLTYLLFLGMATSLFITGGGAFAFDLPI